MRELVVPDVRFHEAWLASHREWGPGEHEDGFGVRAGDDLSDRAQFAGWVAWLRSQPGEVWWIMEDEAILGGIVLRATAGQAGRVTGHIGYGVAPSARGRGVASWALREVLDRAGSAGMPGCVLVCLHDNVASIRTIERAGGVLTAQVEDGEHLVRRYWVATRADAAHAQTA